MKTIMIKVPEKMAPYVRDLTLQEELVRNAMLLYPSIKNNVISCGKAAEILGISKTSLIELYGELGLSYLGVSVLEEDLSTINDLRNK